MHEERKNKHEDDSRVLPGAKPHYLIERTGASEAKVSQSHHLILFIFWVIFNDVFQMLSYLPEKTML